MGVNDAMKSKWAFMAFGQQGQLRMDLSSFSHVGTAAMDAGWRFVYILHFAFGLASSFE